MLLLSGNITLNPGLKNFGLLNCHFIRDKSPLIGNRIVSSNVDVLALAENHIQNSDTDSLLEFVTPPGLSSLIGARRLVMVVVWIPYRKDLPVKNVDAPSHSTFKNIVISIVTH